MAVIIRGARARASAPGRPQVPKHEVDARLVAPEAALHLVERVDLGVWLGRLELGAECHSTTNRAALPEHEPEMRVSLLHRPDCQISGHKYRVGVSSAGRVEPGDQIRESPAHGGEADWRIDQ